MRVLITIILLCSSVAASGAEETEPPFRIAIAGLVHGHVEGVLWNCRDRDDMELVGVWEPDRELFDGFKEKYGLKDEQYFADLETMLARTKPEGVSVMTSTLGHLPVVRLCASHGIDAMVEKPLATTLAEAREIAALAEQSGIEVLTNYETSWYSSNHRTRQLVDDGLLGEIRRIVVHDGHQGPIEIGCSDTFVEWLTDPIENGGGGAIMDFGCYGALLSTWVLNGKRPESVTAVTRQIKPDLYPKVDDDATIILAYDDCQTIIQASWCWTYDRKDFHVYGTHGYVHADRWSKIAISLDDQPPHPPEQTEAPPLAPGYDNEWSFFKHVARDRVQPDELSSLELNLVVMEILDAAKTSAREGRSVRLP